MYHPIITRQQLKKAEELAAEQWYAVSGQSFTLRRHTPAEVRTAIDHFNSLITETGQLRRQLTLDERKWILNERTLCRWDFIYWLKNYHHILTWENQLILMTPNVAQSIIIDLYAEAELKGHAIAQLILKARQEGVTTLKQAVVAHRVQFFPNVISIVGSSRPDKSRKMVEKMELSWRNQPWYIRPRMTAYRAGEYIEFGALGSSVGIQHGSKIKSGMARGETPTVVHLSEVSEFLNPQEDIDSAILFAMHEAPNMFLALESTAHGMMNWWHKKWLYAKDHWNDPNEPSMFQPVFLPWYVASDIYPTPTWLLRNPIPDDWKPSAICERHALRAAEFVQNWELLNKYLGKGWTMPRSQQWYWEVTRNQYAKEDRLNRFYAELCSDDVEAFAQDSASVFDAETIMLYNEHKQMPIAVFGLDGPADEIRPELRPDKRLIDPSLKPIDIDKKYTLYPLLLSGYPSQTDPMNKFFIWEWPADEIEYGLGVDTSQGIGQDRSVIEVMRKANLLSTARQCAEFSSPHISSADLPPYVHSLARLFSRKLNGEPRQPLLVIEVNNGGDACQLAMRKMGWGRFHQWVRYDRKVIDLSKATSLGASTNVWSRDLVITWLVKAIKDYMIDVDSPWLVQELATLGRMPGVHKIEAFPGAHDDRVMALGWVFLSLHVTDSGNLKSVFGRGRIQQATSDKKAYATRPPSILEQPIHDTDVERWIAAKQNAIDMPWLTFDPLSHLHQL